MFAYSFALIERAKAELSRLSSDRKGITALEYGIMAAVMVAVLATAFQALTGQLTTLFTSIGTKLNATY
jgi:pilus assembly protein Flp/PilA